MTRCRAMVAAVCAGVLLVAASGPAAAPAAPGGAIAELTARPWLYEVVRHLYRWYIDERDIDVILRAGEVVFWVREVTRPLDEGDRSLFGEVMLPQFSMTAKVKKADYTIPELNVTVRNDVFKITNVERVTVPERMPEGFTEVRAVYADMRDELFRTRSVAAIPEGELLERMRTAARQQLQKEIAQRGGTLPQGGVQAVHLAPLSPVANEAWVYWETGRTLIRFASDIDLANPAVWDHQELSVKLYDMNQKVVVSLDEVAGSNAFMTRDHAGRALFNCVVLGRRVELPPLKPAAEPPAPR